MKTRISVFLTAIAALILLTAASVDRTSQPIPLSDQQLMQIVGGEEAMGCSEDLAKAILDCSQQKENYNECIQSAADGYFWCRVWEFVTWIFSWIF